MSNPKDPKSSDVPAGTDGKTPGGVKGRSFSS